MTTKELQEIIINYLWDDDREKNMHILINILDIYNISPIDIYNTFLDDFTLCSMISPDWGEIEQHNLYPYFTEYKIDEFFTTINNSLYNYDILYQFIIRIFEYKKIFKSHKTSIDLKTISLYNRNIFENIHIFKLVDGLRFLNGKITIDILTPFSLINTLYLDNCYVNMSSLLYLNKLSKLTMIDCIIDFEEFKNHLPNVSYLDIQNCKFVNGKLHDLLTQFPSLQVCDVNNKKI